MIAELLQLSNQTHVFHWQTASHAEHSALGGLYDKLDGLIDSFIETYAGKYGSVERSSGGAFNVGLQDYVSNADCLAFCDFGIKYLSETLTAQVDPKCTDLLNIIADMIGAFNHTKYLLRQA